MSADTTVEVPENETPDVYGAFPRLTDEQIARLEQHGSRAPTTPGQVLYCEGDPACDFYIVLEGTGVYYSATKMEANLCTGDPAAVVGGGNSAGQATVFLSRSVSSVRLVVRGDDLSQSMSRYLIDRIERLPNVEIVVHNEVRSLFGRDNALEAIVVEDRHTGEQRRFDCRALFVFIGAKPHTDWLRLGVALDDRGFVLTGDDLEAHPDGTRGPLETSHSGVFAAGDVRSGSVKRVASAVGEGAMAVHLVHEHLR